MSYGMIVSGTDLQRLQDETNVAFAKLESRIKELEDREVKTVPKKAAKVKETTEKA
jgi:hypothetical protein